MPTTVGVQLDLFAGEAGTYLLFLYDEGTLINTGGDTLTEGANGFFTASVAETLVTTTSYEARITFDGDIIYTGWLLLTRSNTIDDPGTGQSGGGPGERVVTVTVQNNLSALIPNASVNVLDASDVPLGISSHTGTLGVVLFNLDDGNYKFLVGAYPGYDTHVAEAFTVSSGSVTTTLTIVVGTPPATELIGTAPTALLTSLGEIERVMSVEGHTNHTEDYTPDTDVIDEIIYRATETVLQYLRGRYALTDMYLSYWVRMRTTYIACYLLSIRQGNPALYGDLYAEAMMDLDAARSGRFNIGLPTTARAVLQTPMLDSRFYTPARINPHRSTKVYPGQKLPYFLGPNF